MNNIKISERLQKVAALVKPGNVVADIGTDHGYLPIYLVQNQIAPKVIAMDVRKGPLSKASDNVMEYGVSEFIELRLSDGLAALEPGEADTVTICGMGGRLMQSLLERGRDRISGQTQLILSAQSELSEFRSFLRNNGFLCEKEHMLSEDGQYYVILECRLIKDCDYDQIQNDQTQDDQTQEEPLKQQIFDRYGKSLLESGNLCLKEYLLREKCQLLKVYDKLNGIEYKKDALQGRIAEVKRELEYIACALEYF